MLNEVLASLLEEGVGMSLHAVREEPDMSLRADTLSCSPTTCAGAFLALEDLIMSLLVVEKEPGDDKACASEVSVGGLDTSGGRPGARPRAASRCPQAPAAACLESRPTPGELLESIKVVVEVIDPLVAAVVVATPPMLRKPGGRGARP